MANHENHIQLAENYMKIWNAGQDHLLEKLADPELEVSYTHFGKTYSGINEYREILKMTHQSFPDLAISIKNIIPADKAIVVEWEYAGTHQNGNLFGVEASGKKVNVSGVTLLEIKKGKIVSEKGIVDNLSLIMQLGALSQN